MHLNVLANIQRLLTSGLGSDKTVVSVGLGAAIAYALPVPATGARNADTYYTQNCFTNVDSFVCELNEMFLVEIQTALDVARTLWTMRYRSVHLSESDIDDLAFKANPIRDYLSSFSLTDEQIQAVLATGVLISNQLRGSDLCKSVTDVRG